MERWVQHISGLGDKWEVLDEWRSEWKVRAEATSPAEFYCVPKSEYVLCDPRERWVDVTKHCVSLSMNHIYDEKERIAIENNSFYRLRKMWLRHGDNAPQWAFIVEQKE